MALGITIRSIMCFLYTQELSHHCENRLDCHQNPGRLWHEPHPYSPAWTFPKSNEKQMEKRTFFLRTQLPNVNWCIENKEQDTATQVTLKDTGLSETDRTQKDHRSPIPLTGGAWRSRTRRDRKQKGGCQGLEGGSGELLFNGFGASVLQGKGVPETGCTALWMYLTDPHAGQGGCCKMVKMLYFTLRVFYHN